MWYEQFNELCKEKSTTPTAFVQDVLKLSSSKVTAWKSGSIPKIETLQKIAEYFNVTVGYLFDGPKKVVIPNEYQELIDLYNGLDDYEQGLVMGYLTRISEEHKNSAAEKGA